MKLDKSYCKSDTKCMNIIFDFSTVEKIHQFIIDMIFPQKGIDMQRQEDIDQLYLLIKGE